MLEKFLMGPNAAQAHQSVAAALLTWELAEVAEAYAAEHGVALSGLLSPHCATFADSLHNGWVMEPVNPISPDLVPADADDEATSVLLASHVDDPFDLSGARGRYLRLRTVKNQPHDRAALTAKLASESRRNTTVDSYTAHLRTWYDYCVTSGFDPHAYDPDDVSMFLGWLAERGRLDNGERLQGSTFQTVRSALIAGAKSVSIPDPFEVDSTLGRLISGYAKAYGRPAVQAMAIRLRHVRLVLGRLLDKPGHRDASVAADAALVALVGHPGLVHDPAADTWSGIGTSRAADLRLEDLEDLPEGGLRLHLPSKRGGVAPLVVTLPYPGRELHHEGGETPLEALLCPTTALKTLRAIYAKQGRTVGPVFTTNNGNARSPASVDSRMVALARRVYVGDLLTPIAFGPGRTLPDVDHRIAMLDTIGQLPFKRIRDAAMIGCAWHGSLRRSEASALTWGDIGTIANHPDAVMLRIKKSKTDQQSVGRYVAVPPAKYDIVLSNGDTVAHTDIVDLKTLLNIYARAWARHVGRPPEDKDPVFISSRNHTPVAITGDSHNRCFQEAAAAVNIEAERRGTNPPLDVPAWERLSHHGLRAGWATTVLMNGMPHEVVANTQGRASVQSLAGYIRLADPIADTASFIFDVEAAGEEMLTFAMQSDDA